VEMLRHTMLAAGTFHSFGFDGVGHVGGSCGIWTRSVAVLRLNERRFIHFTVRRWNAANCSRCGVAFVSLFVGEKVEIASMTRGGDGAPSACHLVLRCRFE
jgi:hypothetical protein